MTSLQTQIIWAGRVRWTLSGAMVLLVAAFYLGAFRPKTARLVSLRDQTEQARKELTDCRAQTAILSTVAADVERLKARLNALLPRVGDILEYAADMAALDLEGVEPMGHPHGLRTRLGPRSRSG